MQNRDFLEVIADDLRDPEFVEAYLQAAREEGLPTFLLAIRDVIGATVGMSRMAERTGMSRESLYKALSETGNPQLRTVDRVLEELGFNFVPVKQTDAKISL
jgi:probable addiction module antidote protein